MMRINTKAPFTIIFVCFAQPYSGCRSPLEGASRLQAICEAYQLPVQSMISYLTGIFIPVGGHASLMKKLVFDSPASARSVSHL